MADPKGTTASWSLEKSVAYAIGFAIGLATLMFTIGLATNPSLIGYTIGLGLASIILISYFGYGIYNHLQTIKS